jgi:DNA primase
MRGNVEAVKERLDIAEVIGGYIKLEKAGANYKAKCPFHNEKTPSFFISPARQTYYCFGCGVKGDIFTFVEEIEGVDFKDALKTLAEKAGVELKYERREEKDERDILYNALEDATLFFEENLKKASEAKKYLESRGITDESMKEWRLGFAPDEWRLLREHMHSLGHKDEILLKAGLVKQSADHKDKEPYDTFRGRIIFPIRDTKGMVIAFSGRVLGDIEPKYLNSPDSDLFHKSEVLYGLDKAREDIRRKDYAVLVEGQMDLVHSHQAEVKNTVASSGTAFTQAHLERLRKLSPRIILAFDGDSAGMKAAEKSSALALALGMEVKIARLPEGKDPADLARESAQAWKDALRASKPAVEIFLDEILKTESDPRKAGKAIEKRLLPVLLLVQSAMERAHYISLIAKRTGIREEVILEDLKRAKAPETHTTQSGVEKEERVRGIRSRKDELDEVTRWLKDNPEDRDLLRQEAELKSLIRVDELNEEIAKLRLEMSKGGDEVFSRLAALTKERDVEKRKVL